jgi:hypothetical protein
MRYTMGLYMHGDTWTNFLTLCRAGRIGRKCEEANMTMDREVVEGFKACLGVWGLL